MYRRLLMLIFLLLCSVSEAVYKFVPEQPVIPVKSIKPNSTGYILTVLRGTEPSRIPIRIVSIIPQKPGQNISDNILIKFTDGHKLAKGMSGSPVYINGKLAGAVGSGWDFSDHSLALVTPIEAMCRIFEMDDGTRTNAVKALSLTEVSISGLSNSNSLMKLGRRLGITLTQGMSSGAPEIAAHRMKPGDSVSALLVWGDVEISASGTVTATSKDGRFIAFGHPFLKRGNASYPSAKSVVHDTINSTSFPFKLTSPVSINGTIIQDREAGIGGQLGYYAPSVSAELIFRDLDQKTEKRYRFRTAADDFMTAELLEGVYSGLFEEAWGRKGQGTMSVNLRIDGRNVPKGWARRDIFFSEKNITEEAPKQALEIINAFLTQPFSETMPAGFSVTVEATEKPRIMLIEDVEAPDTARPGQEIEITVKLRGWRTEPVTRKFKMKIPSDASGVTELIVRGGSIEPSSQISVDEGWKSINSLERMLTEFKALDANNELILELISDTFEEALKEAINSRKSPKPHERSEKNPDLLSEEEEYLSETKERRIKEGSLKVMSSEYFIDGLMKRIIHVEK